MKNGWRLAIAFAALTGLPCLAGDYVDSRVCAICHPKIYEAYQRTGMARSFYRPGPDYTVEDYSVKNRYYHQASDTYFAMFERGGKYYQRRYQIDARGLETNADEKEIDYVMGSGAHVRTYLHRSSSGALFQLPLAWYAEKGGYWAMNPGYDKPDQPNARRKVGYECMFCHNAYPEVRAGRDQPGAEPHFSGRLPEGIDCQRCHGPGGRHVGLAQATGVSARAIAGAIVNPARLSRERRMEICIQCHLETDSMPFPHAIFKYPRGPFAYRPGEPLENFILFFDHPDQPGEDRFQIVSSVYRLQMSACFRKSQGALECTTCHKPHAIEHHQQGQELYDQVCLRCHTKDFRRLVASGRHTASAECVGCHMRKRRTSDVVHAVITDHLIQRKWSEGDLLAERSERNGAATIYHGEVLPYYPRPFAKTAENEVYLALAQVREDNNWELGIPRLATAIAKYRSSRPEFYIELGDAWLRHGKALQAIPLYEEALRRQPDSLDGLLGWGRALQASGRGTEAAGAFRRTTRIAPQEATPWRELGQLELRQGNRADARAALEKSLQLDQEAPDVHYALGLLWAQPVGDPARAEASFREALRLAPGYPEAHMNLAILLFQAQRIADSTDHFERAIRYRPGYSLAHLNYALMLEKLNRPLEAEPHLRQAASSSDAAVRDAALKLLGELPK